MQFVIHEYSLQNEKLKLELESLEKELERQKKEAESTWAQVDFESGEPKGRTKKIKGTVKGKSQYILVDDDLDYPETLNSLILKERTSNSELQEARKALTKGWEDLSWHRSSISIKRIGELNEKPFRDACLQKFPNGEADLRGVELCSLWQEEIKDSGWHPFKIVTINGKLQETIDDNDEKLKTLRNDLGEDVYKAVTTTLLEVNEYNPSGRYAFSELWNFKEDRKS